jgi:hypothetical protein
VKEVRALAATGMLGSGFREESLKKGISWNPDFIGCDAGSTDPGPYFLGSGEMHFSDEAIRRDLRLILLAARNFKIPAIIGSAGTGGADIHLNKLITIIEDISKNESLHFKLGVIHSEQKKDYLLSMFRNGKIKPLSNAPILNEEKIIRSIRIVGMAGIESFIECLDNGADVIVAGRASDTAIFAALPVKNGLPIGVSLHAGKILECGAACVSQCKYPDCMFAVIDEEGFTIEPPNPDYQCSPLSVASHMLYENSSPYELIEPSGILDTSNATYETINSCSVRVRGSNFRPSEKYTVKLEGVELAGFKSIILGGVRDPIILKQLNSWITGMKEKIMERIVSIYGESINKRYSLNFRIYGLNAVMGKLEPNKNVGHEVGIVIEILANTEDLARSLISSAGHIATHYPVPEWSGLITGLAYPYSPSELFLGPVYQFNMNHVVEPENYKAMFPVEYINI